MQGASTGSGWHGKSKYREGAAGGRREHWRARMLRRDAMGVVGSGAVGFLTRLAVRARQIAVSRIDRFNFPCNQNFGGCWKK